MDGQSSGHGDKARTRKMTTAITIRRYADDPMAFLEDLIIPAPAHGPIRFGDVMAGFQRETFAKLTPSLLALARGKQPPIRRFFVERTKGASKDSDLAAALLWLLAFTTWPMNCECGAANQRQASELRKAAQDILWSNEWLARRVSIQNWKIACTATRSSCEISATDMREGGDTTHGSRPTLVLLNELSHIPSEGFAQTMLDNAAKMPNGIVVIATNAGFLDTWQYKWREDARKAQRWSFHQFAKPAPWVDLADVEEARGRGPVRCNRLWYGIWSSDEGQAIDSEDIEAAITADGPLTPIQAERGHWQIVGGLDLGVNRDHSALVLLGVRPGSHRVRVASVESWKPPRGGKVDLMRVEDAVLRAHRTFGLRALLYDKSQAELMVQRLQRKGVPCSEMSFSSGRNLDLMASTMMQAFSSRVIDMYRNDQLLRDLAKISIVDRGWGQKLEAPADADGHADSAIAMGICLPMASRMAHAGAHELGSGIVIKQMELNQRRNGVHLFRQRDRGVPKLMN